MDAFTILDHENKDMPEISFKYEESSFADVVKRKTQSLKENELFYHSIYETATLESEESEYIFRKLKEHLKPLFNKTDKMVFISELLIHLRESRDIIVSEYNNDPRTIELLDEIVYFLFREKEKLKLGVDKNAFTNRQVVEMSAKINQIINKLEKLGMGQEVVFDRIEELKEDYREIMNSFGLGKKPFFQRFAGIFASYVGEKGADEVFDILRPLLREMAATSAKQLIG